MDCGGGKCPKCPMGKACLSHSDCLSDSCSADGGGGKSCDQTDAPTKEPTPWPTDSPSTKPPFRVCALLDPLFDWIGYPEKTVHVDGGGSSSLLSGGGPHGGTGSWAPTAWGYDELDIYTGDSPCQDSAEHFSTTKSLRCITV